eukprot:8523711-Alexandrium_andersonii.AAC.1
MPWPTCHWTKAGWEYLVLNLVLNLWPRVWGQMLLGASWTNMRVTSVLLGASWAGKRVTWK